MNSTIKTSQDWIRCQQAAQEVFLAFGVLLVLGLTAAWFTARGAWAILTSFTAYNRVLLFGSGPTAWRQRGALILLCAALTLLL